MRAFSSVIIVLVSICNVCTSLDLGNINESGLIRHVRQVDSSISTVSSIDNSDFCERRNKSEGYYCTDDCERVHCTYKGSKIKTTIKPCKEGKYCYKGTCDATVKPEICSVSPFKCVCSGKSDIYLPDYEDNRSYYTCSSNDIGLYKIPNRCAPDKTFNPNYSSQTEVCLSVLCPSQYRNGIGNYTSNDLCPEGINSGRRRFPGTCSYYYSCEVFPYNPSDSSQYQIQVYKCESGVFDPVYNNCTTKPKEPCPYAYDSQIGSGLDGKPICCRYGYESVAPGECTRNYYYCGGCNYRTPVDYTCRDGYYFDDVAHTCYTIRATSKCQQCNRRALTGLLPANATCSSDFYYCNANDFKTIDSCADHLVFDPSIKKCRLPSKVNGCKGVSSALVNCTVVDFS